MISNNRADYVSADEWLSALKQDEIWLSQLQQLQDSTPDDASTLRDRAFEKIGKGEAYGFWDSYNHKVEPVVREVWEIAELSLSKLKIQTIGMLSIEWLEQHVSDNRSLETGEQPSAIVDRLKPIFYGSEQEARDFLKSIQGMKPTQITDKVNQLVDERDEECQLIWGGLYGKGTLVELFRQFVSAGLVTVPNGFTLPAILEGHFKDMNGLWLTSLDKGNAANDKALPFIKECVKLLKATPEQMMYGNFDDDEDFQSQYDPYDHQDLNLHKR